MVDVRTLCPCGSGKLFQGCHGVTLTPTPQEIGAAAIAALNKGMRDQAAWRATYGDVPPPFSAKVGGHRLVAVGNSLHSFNGKTFHEFLLAYFDGRLGREWLSRESSKQRGASHPLIRWRRALIAFQKRHTTPGAAMNSAPGEGVVPHYFRLAHNVYTLQHTGLLEERLLNRLRQRDNFQGARYEIEVAAGCRRAGFQVVLEDETDVSRSHCEFAISHPSTNRWFSVEVKSRHRDGVLGRIGNFNSRKVRPNDVAQIVIRALRKEADHQRLVFVDLNLPDRLIGKTPEATVEVLEKTLAELKSREDPGSPWPPCILIVTNRPHHFAQARERDCREIIMGGTLNMPPIHNGKDLEPGAAIPSDWPEIILLAEAMTRHEIPIGFGLGSADEEPLE